MWWDMINYNTSKPIEPPKKIFSYQALYFIFSLLAILYMVNEIVVFDLVVSGYIKSGATNFGADDNTIYLILSMISRISIPLGAFLVFLSARRADKKFILNLTVVTVLFEIIYDLYSFDKFMDIKFQSPLFGILLGAFFTIAWQYFDFKKIMRLPLAALYIFISINIGVDYGFIIGILYIILNYLEPNRKGQALFSFAICIPGASMVVAPIFYYFYDENNNRKNYNSSLNFIFPIIALLLWRLRILILR